MGGLKNYPILFILILFHMNLFSDEQLIGEEKKYVFLEQAMLERVRSTLLDMTKDLEERMRDLEEKLNSVTNMIPAYPPKGPLNGCPASNNCAVDGLECSRLVLDPATLAHTFLSRDKLTLTNRQPDNFYNWTAVNDRRYYGAQGSTAITGKQKMYFETDIYYRIEKDLLERNMVFEVAFATEKAIGKSHYVGGQQGAWSIFAYNLTSDVALCTQVNGGTITTLKVLSNATPGTEIYLKLGFFINRVDRTIAVFDINMNRKIYTFTDVDGSLELWPVFGVYSKGESLVRLRLNSERDIISVPCGLF